MKRKVEVFTAGCPVCDPVVQMVKELTCGNCEVIIYDLVKQCEEKTCVNKLKENNVQKLPAIVVNGELLSCCQDSGITKEDLITAGIGR